MTTKPPTPTFNANHNRVVEALRTAGKTGSNDDARNESALGMPPIVVDAGALDLLPGKVPAQVVVTPHVGELARMLTRLDGNEASVDKVRSQPLACARSP